MGSTEHTVSVLGGSREGDHQAGQDSKVSGGPPGHVAREGHHRMSYTCQIQQQKPLLLQSSPSIPSAEKAHCKGKMLMGILPVITQHIFLGEFGAEK